MKSRSFYILTFVLFSSLIFGGCASTEQQAQMNNKTSQSLPSKYDIDNEKSGLQKHMELVTSESKDKTQYESLKPERYIRFSWVPQQSPELNFTANQEYELYALVDPNDYNIEDFNATQVFYLEVVNNDKHAYYGPFETKHLDFTQ